MGLYLLIYIDKDFQLSAYFPDKYWRWLTSGDMWKLGWLELLSASCGFDSRWEQLCGNEKYFITAFFMKKWQFYIYGNKY